MVILFAPCTTWKFVTISPDSSQINPVPLPRGISMTLSEKRCLLSCVLVTNTTLGLALLKTDILFCSSFVRNADVASALAVAVGFSSLVADTYIPIAIVIATKVAPKIRIVDESIEWLVCFGRLCPRYRESDLVRKGPPGSGCRQTLSGAAYR